MSDVPVLVEVWRGDYLECVHRGHAVVVDETGQIVDAWGDPAKEVLPRSSCKMLQALPLVESGAAGKYGLRSEQLALACASHNGAAVHTKLVNNWLKVLGKSDHDLKCGPQTPNDQKARTALIREGDVPCQYHNNCSGKHAGFLSLSDHLGGGAEYNDPSHSVQIAVREAFEDMTGEASSGYAIDGCSAPNFACSLVGLARAMAKMAKPRDDTRGNASRALVDSMIAHPVLVAGEGRACTDLITAASGVAVKTGAEGVFTGILREKGLGIALKIEDGATRASEAVMAALLVKYGILDAQNPAAKARMNAPILNRRGIVTGHVKALI